MRKNNKENNDQLRKQWKPIDSVGTTIVQTNKQNTTR